MEKGEIAHFEQFHRFQQGFPKAFFFSVLIWVYMEEWMEQWDLGCHKNILHFIIIH